MTKNAPTNIPGSERVGARKAKIAKPQATTAYPTGSNGHSPRESMMRPPKSDVAALPNTGTRIAKPAMNAVKPVAPSRYIGSKTLQLKLPIMAMVVKMMDGQNADALHGRKVDQRVLATQLAKNEQRNGNSHHDKERSQQQTRPA